MALTLPELVTCVIDFLPKMWPETSNLRSSCPQLMLLTLPQYDTVFLTSILSATWVAREERRLFLWLLGNPRT